MSKIKYVNIDDDRFWEILFDEAYVEGQQSVRIRDALKNISTSEKEISRKTVKRIISRLKKHKSDWNDDYNVPINNAIKIVKEVGGINVLQSKEC